MIGSKATKRKRSAENRYADKVRHYVMEVRDSDCRLACMGVGPCSGVPEWAHLGDKRRCFTRGMKPEDRHSSRWTIKLCTVHHKRYDAHEFEIEYSLEIEGADGPIQAVRRTALK